MPSFRSASSCSWVSLSRLDLVFDTHTPSFPTTGSVSPSTVICSLCPPGNRPVRAFPLDPLREGCRSALERLLRLARTLSPHARLPAPGTVPQAA